MARPPHEVDPRPDLTTDSAVWTPLLQAAWQGDRDLYGVLHALRSQGARLKAHPRWGYTLEPLIDRDDWPSQAAYDAFKTTWVLPHQQTLIALLHALGEARRASGRPD